MDVEDGGMESSILPFFQNSIESNERGEVLSPEDIAWIDSCLVKEPESSESNLNSLKDALLEIFSSQPELFNSSAAVSDAFPEVDDVKILPSSEEAETLVLVNEETKTEGVNLPIKLKNNTLKTLSYKGYPFLLSNTEGLKESGGTGSKLDLGSSDYELEPSNVDDMVLGDEEATTKGDDLPIKLKSNTLQSITFEGNPFLPTYTEGLKESGRTESMLDLDSSAYGVEPSTEDIFRVWDLDVPAEDGELVKQLNKALTESSIESIPSTLNDSGQWKDLEEESVDNLIAGISDLSLQ